MGLRNLPQDEPRKLADCISCREGQVSSIGLTSVDCPVAMTLFEFSAGQSVSDEAYEADVMYCLLEGSLHLTLEGRAVDFEPGDAFKVERGVEHALAGPAEGACKFVQVIVP